MSDTAHQSPLGVNVLGALLQNTGLCINPVTAGYVGISHDVNSYTPGTIVADTCLSPLTNAINAAYSAHPVSTQVYNNLISIGSDSIPALGNSSPPTYTWEGAPGWGGTLYSAGNPATKWGYIRLLALQAWNDFNYNNDLSSSGSYKSFLAAFQAASSFIEYSNPYILSASKSKKFLDGTYSNMNDLMTGDLAGVSLSSNVFGQDLINSGNAIDLSTIDTFGLPSNLLNTLQNNNALTKSVTLALLSLGFDTTTLGDILSGKTTPNTSQQKNMYDAFTIIVGPELQEVLVPLNVHTKGLESLADLLNPMKLFPNSYQTLTVPLYNTGG
jgi:hypothetical protein